MSRTGSCSPAGGSENRSRGGVAAAVEAVITSLVSKRGLKNTTLVNRTKRIRWFATFVEAHGITTLDQVSPKLAEDFVNSKRASGEEVRDSERHARSASLMLLYKEARVLGLASTDPARDIKLPPRNPVHARPATDAEVEALEVRAARPGDTRPAVCLALAEGAAWTSEIPRIRVSDLDLDAGAVFIHGGATTRARVGRLTEWGITQLRRRALSITPVEGPNPVLMGEGRWDDPDEGRAAATMALTGLIRAARLSAPGLNPRSIPLWAAKKVLAEKGTAEAVALALGIKSLDQAAEMVGHVWWPEEAP